MTAIRRRRTRSTVIALIAAVGALVAAGGLAVAGVRSLKDSRAGRQAEGPGDVTPTRRLPNIATALVGTVDEGNRVTSLVVMTLEPDGTGGTIVEIAASADAEHGLIGVLNPLDAVYAVEGPETFRQAVGTLTDLSFDVIEIVDEQRFAELVSPLGDLEAMFQVPHHDASSGEVWEAGDAVLSGPAAARAVTATDPAIADWYLEAGRAAIWRAVAERVGAGIGSATPVASDQDVPVPSSLDEFLDRLYAGPVQFRQLGFRVIPADEVESQLAASLDHAFGPDAVESVVAHDPAEVVMVLAAVGQGRIGAPLDAPTVRVVSGFTDDELAPDGVNRSDVLKAAIDRLLFVKVNVVAVADLPGSTVPAVTQIAVADPAVVEAVSDYYGDLFGEIDVDVAAVATDGVDIEVTLGRPFLDQVVGGELPDDVAGSLGDASTDDSSGGG